MARPWFKFYPSDWRGDHELRRCSYAARGLWADLLTYMHEGEPYGHLSQEGMQDASEIAAMLSRPASETRKALSELETKKVSSRTKDGILFSRKMVRAKEKEEEAKAYGKEGGNPNIKNLLNGGVNPTPAPITIARELNNNIIKNGNGKYKRPPEHGDKTSDGKMIFMKPALEGFAEYDSDYREAKRGQLPKINNHGGFWFWIMGEANRPKEYRTKARPSNAEKETV